MAEVDRARLKLTLGRYYGAQREVASPHVIESLAAAMVAEDARSLRARGRRLSLPAFVTAQVRFIPAWTWGLQALVVAIMGALALMAGEADAIRPAIGILSAATVLVGVPVAGASKLHGVAELEYACTNNAAAVLAARLVVLGCSSALAVGVMVGAVASLIDASAFQVALWACPPFFLACAGSLIVLRRAAPNTATMLCVACVGVCAAALLLAAHALPGLYGQASLATWATASAIALAWLVREVAQTYRAVASGLDAFSPHLANTYN